MQLDLIPPWQKHFDMNLSSKSKSRVKNRFFIRFAVFAPFNLVIYRLARNKTIRVKKQN